MAEPLRRVAVLTHHLARTTDRTLHELAAEGRRLGLELVVPADEAAKHRLSRRRRLPGRRRRRAARGRPVPRARWRRHHPAGPGPYAGQRCADHRASTSATSAFWPACARPTGAPVSNASRRAATRSSSCSRSRPAGTASARWRSTTSSSPGCVRSACATRLRSVGHAGGGDALRRHDRRFPGRLHRLQPLLRRAARGLGRRRPGAQLHRPALARVPTARAAPRPRHPGEQRLADRRSRGAGRRFRVGRALLWRDHRDRRRRDARAGCS